MRFRKTILSLLFLSGAAGLIYELVWMRLLALSIGSSTYAISVTLGAFMGGLAIGSYIFGKWILPRFNRPLLLFGLLELGIGLYGLVSPLLLSVVSSPNSLFARFLIAFLLLVVPTLLMGGTLPVIAEAMADPKRLGRGLGILYSVNTWGGVAGTLLATLVSIYFLGVRGTIYLAVGINLIVSSVFLHLAKKESTVVVPPPTPSEIPPVRGGTLLLVAVFLSGFTALAYELLWTRLLTLVIGSTVYAFGAMLASFLAGLAIGSSLYVRLSRRKEGTVGSFALLQGGIGLVTLLLIIPVSILPFVYLSLVKGLGLSFLSMTTVELLVSFGLLLLPTTLFGMSLPLACGILGGRDKAGAVAGKVIFANTGGAVFGSLLAGFFILENLGVRTGLMTVAFINVGVGLALYLSLGQWRRAILVAACPLLLLSFLPSWSGEVLSSGAYVLADDYLNHAPQGLWKSYRKRMEARKVIFQREGANALVAVKENPLNGIRVLTINGKPEATNEPMGDVLSHRLIGAIPFLIKPDAKNTLLVGLGSGVSSGEILSHPVSRLDIVEIEPAVVEAASYFNRVNRKVLSDPRVNLILEDARRLLSRATQKYDLIVSAPSNPWVSGASNLFTCEYFRLLRQRLSEDGIAAVWLQTFDINPKEVKTGIRTFVSEFEGVSLWEAENGMLVMVGQKEKTTIPAESLKNPRMAGRFLLADEALRSFVGHGPLNSDNHPILEFSTPRTLYANFSRLENIKILSRARESVSPYAKGKVDHEILARYYRKTGLEKLAYQEISAALSEGQITADLYQEKGEILINMGRHKEAVTSFERAFSLQDNSTRRLDLARAYFESGQTDRALFQIQQIGRFSNLEKAVRTHQPRHATYVFLGQAYAGLDKRAEAARMFNRALALDSKALGVLLGGER